MESELTPASSPQPPITRPGIWVRFLVFGFIAWITLTGVGLLLYPWAGSLITGIAASFFSAALANGITLRIYERGRLDDIGLDFSRTAFHNGAIGFAGGLVAAGLVGGIPLLIGIAKLEPGTAQPHVWWSFLFVSAGLFFGAVGEEMLFRGYGFQILLKRWGPFATILPLSTLFAWAHANNPDATPLALINTFAWGVLLGFCFLRSGDLWLPIGVHFGWNFALPLFGVNLSGHTMSVTGYVMTWKTSALWSGGNYGPEASLLTLLVLPLTGLYLWKAPVRVRKPFLLTGSPEEP